MKISVYKVWEGRQTGGSRNHRGFRSQTMDSWQTISFWIERGLPYQHWRVSLINLRWSANRVSRKIKSVICLSAHLSCFLVFLTADLIFANLAFFLLLCPGKIKSVICLSAQLSSFFRQDPREIQFPSHQVSSEMTTKMSSLLLCPAITNTPFTPTALALLPPHHSL